MYLLKVAQENNDALLLTITVPFYKELKTFKMDLVRKDHKKLEHLVMELRNESASLRSENSRLKEENLQLRTQLEMYHSAQGMYNE